MVNVGGFVATVVISLGFGATLTALGGSTPHHLRLALFVPLAVQVYGTVRVAVWHRRLRHTVLQWQQQGRPVPVAVARRYWWDLRDRP